MAMAKNHGAKDQKRAAKQKAKRMAKRAVLFQRDSKDPTVRLQRADKWPVVQALVWDKLWEDGFGYVLIARRDLEGRIVFAVFLVDVWCLGVKDTFWRAGTSADLEEMIKRIRTTGTMGAIAPACLAKIVTGAVEYAQSFGFPPHPDFRHASKLLDGIDPSSCPSEFKFGRGGRPFYVQGQFESSAEAAAIMQRVQSAGGHYIISLSGDDVVGPTDLGREIERFEALEDEGFPDEPI
jgi:hypothetical protein